MMPLRNLQCDRQSETAALFLGAGAAIETIEHTFALFVGKARSAVGYSDADQFALAFDKDIDLPAFRCVADCVVEQIGEQYFDSSRLHAHFE